jgi:phage-related minor tail protein
MNTLRQSISAAGSSGGGGGSGLGIVKSVLGIVGAAAGAPSIGTALNVANSVGMAGGDSLGSLIGQMGWSGGGFTGRGGKYEVAGAVHRGEFVVNAENTRRLGLGFLNSLNAPGAGYAEGGYVGPDYSSSLNSNPAARVVSGSGEPTITFSPQTTIHVDSRSDRSAVIADVQRVVVEGQKAYTEQLQRLKVLPR